MPSSGLGEMRKAHMGYRALVTGGAGFIGSHLTDELLHQGHSVRVLDSLCSQVHGPSSSPPAYLSPEAELQVGDIRNRDAVAAALEGIDVVYHLAAAVGVGQSMYEIDHYVDVNARGTAILLEEMLKSKAQRLVVASSMSIYGEGLYQGADGSIVQGGLRKMQQLVDHEWELRDERGRPLRPLPTPETKTPQLASIYAMTKYDQERMCLIFGQTYRIPVVALRFFNTHGPRQALSNPYTGVLAIFAARLMNDKPVTIFEDGLQQRDFVSVHDVARACCLAGRLPQANGLAINIGSGRPCTIRQIAADIAAVLGKQDIQAEIAQQYRAGDIRHCYADVSLAEDVLGYRPQVGLDAGLRELAQWLSSQVAADNSALAREELDKRGLAV